MRFHQLLIATSLACLASFNSFSTAQADPADTLANSLLTALKQNASTSDLNIEPKPVDITTVAKFRSPWCHANDFTAMAQGSKLLITQAANTICTIPAASAAYYQQNSFDNQLSLVGRSGLWLKPDVEPTITQLKSNLYYAVENEVPAIAIERNDLVLTLQGTTAGATPVLPRKLVNQLPIKEPAVDLKGSRINLTVAPEAVIFAGHEEWKQTRPDFLGANNQKLNKLDEIVYKVNDTAVRLNGSNNTVNWAGKAYGIVDVEGEDSRYNFTNGYINSLRVGQNSYNDKRPTLSVGANFTAFLVTADRFSAADIAGQAIRFDFNNGVVNYLPTARADEIALKDVTITIHFNPEENEQQLRSEEYEAHRAETYEIINFSSENLRSNSFQEVSSDFVQAYSVADKRPHFTDYIGYTETYRDFLDRPVLRIEVPAGQTWTLNLKNVVTPEIFTDINNAYDKLGAQKSLISTYEPIKEQQQKRLAELDALLKEPKEKTAKAREFISDLDTKLKSAKKNKEALEKQREEQIALITALDEKFKDSYEERVKLILEKRNYEAALQAVSNAEKVKLEYPSKKGYYVGFSQIEKSGPGTLKLVNELPSDNYVLLRVLDGDVAYEHKDKKFFPGDHYSFKFDQLVTKDNIISVLPDYKEPSK